MDVEKIVSELADSGRLENADLSHFDFSKLGNDRSYTFQRCKIDDGRLTGDALEGSRWIDCSFLGSVFASCRLSEASFENCRFYDGERNTGARFRFADVGRASFKNCDLSLAAFQGCEAHDIAFEDCRMRGFSAERTTFSRKIGRVERNAASFENCILSDAVMRDLDLSNCTMKRCVMKDADLSSSNLASSEVVDCDLDGVTCEAADFSNSDLRRSSLIGMDLTALQSHSGMIVSAGQQQHLLRSIGIEVWPED